MDFSGSKMNMEFIEGDWKSGNPSDQLSERIVNNPSAFPSTAKRSLLSLVIVKLKRNTYSL